MRELRVRAKINVIVIFARTLRCRIQILGLCSLIFLVFGCSFSSSQTTNITPNLIIREENNTDASTDVKLKGWEHLLNLLTREGVERKLVEQALGSRNMPEKELLVFNLKPQEKRELYRGVNTSIKRKNAYNFYLAYQDYFHKAQELYFVPVEIILAIFQVETSCGRYTGNKSIFPAIARLANATDPEIIRANLKNNPKNKEDDVFKRAKYLEGTFLPHLVATFKLAPDGDVHSLHGSFAGAMGIPQFMPGNIIKYGIDANNDGRVDLYDPIDAIFSTANYLKQHGWNTLDPNLSIKRKVIWEYNRSIPYIDTVLSMSNELQRLITPKKNVRFTKSTRKPTRPIKKFR